MSQPKLPAVDYLKQAHDNYQVMQDHPEWIRPRSEARVFVGQPGAAEATKTTVEPGNTFSPGMRSCGVTWWLRFDESDTFFASEEAPLEALHTRYEGGFLPLIHCAVAVEGIDVTHSLFQDGSAAERSEAVCGRLELHNTQPAPRALRLYLVLRSLGPAGGPVRDIRAGADGRSLRSGRDRPLLGVDRAPTAIGCGVGDPSEVLRRGSLPAEQQADDLQGWCWGVLEFHLTLAAGERWHVHFDCPLQTTGGADLAALLPSTAAPRAQDFAERARAHLAGWRERLATFDVDVPDADYRNAMFAGLQHMLTATVGDQIRIAPLAYPLPWLRDSVHIIRSFDLAGHHDVARAGAEYCARNDFFGGFAAEGDAPGQGIWTIVQHYRLTRDRDWLARMYAAIERKCDWLFRMRRASEPMFVLTDTPVLSYTHSMRTSGLICVAAQDGLIRGSMDNGIGYSFGWVNHWALCGLREAAYAASELGRDDDAARFAAEAGELKTALQRYVEREAEAYFGLERTANSLVWPTRAWEDDPGRVSAGFDEWWRRNRGAGDSYTPEPYWLYFEFAQAHNALLLGKPERAWRAIDYRLRHQDVPGLYGWREGADGIGTDNAIYGVSLANQLRGLHKFDSITPHGWSQAELWLLQRALLVEEWQGGLLVFAGVPEHWLAPGARLAFERLPTWYGRANAELLVDADGDGATIRVAGIAPGVAVRTRRAGRQVETISDRHGAATLRVEPAREP